MWSVRSLNKRLTTPRKLGGIRRVPPVSAHKSGPSLGEGPRRNAEDTCICGVYARQLRRRRLASLKTKISPNPHHGQDAAVLLSRTYVFAAFGRLVPHFLFSHFSFSHFSFLR